MAMNDFGEGAVVQHSMIEANGDWHMDNAIENFRPDKDLNELCGVQSNFPGARVLICLFHRSAPNLNFGKISSDDSSHINAAIHNLKELNCEEEYESAHTALHSVCDCIGFNNFFDYFERNSNARQDRWVMYRWAHLEHFKNHNNNRLENGSMSMTNCGKGLVAYVRHAHNEYLYRIS
ncbi:hypothetical protein PHMEG_0006090 [Phytophthora megakarya]|uniref:Uncharacterized protein n=1 Tax=Phytophthora megakarya TaxID=4795 RepID=A0A225WRG9_9STRA|nr:hypothetical protein PHMEG_0006090 [Phytophthora megakarya]